MLYIALGLAIGLLSGLFGIGGSSISTPLLRTVLGVPSLIALATPLPVTIPTAIAGGLVYHRRGLIEVNVATWSVIGGLPGVIIGATTTAFVPPQWLMVFTGVVIIGIAIRLGWSAIIAAPISSLVRGYDTNKPSRSLLLALGFIIGVLSGLLANGGAFLFIPAFVLILGMPMHRASGTSLVCTACLSVPGTVIHWLLGHIDPAMMLFLGLGVVPASYIGAKAALRLKSVQVQFLFSLFLLAFAVFFIYSQIRG